MRYILFLPGAIYVLVIFFRVVLPLIKIPAWKRLIDDARYERSKENSAKSDFLLEKAIKKYPSIGQVYLEYFLNYSDPSDLQKRFILLLKGYKTTEDPILGFFIGNTYLEEGDYINALYFLEQKEIINYMMDKHIPLLAQLYYEEGEYKKASLEYEQFYRTVFNDKRPLNELLSEQDASELILYALISHDSGKDWKSIMSLIPKSSIHVESSWQDYMDQLQNKLKKLKPALTGINGNPGEFNRKRKLYYTSRISLIQSWL
ncbi:MAG: hypothetical protein PF693_08375 [Spirochaetia bacterium]|jgi:tetratricopeptide (TPR) repeat protein|nr:hypothetical protein [Spirochaetia bacterium]